MNKKIILTGTGLASALIIVLVSCSKSGDSGTVIPPASNVDSALVNISKNIIIPAYQNLSAASIALDASVTAFTTAPDATSLANAQAAFKTAYLAWESCSEYQFGPANDQSLLTGVINIFPTDSNLIKSNISTGTYTIDGLSNLKAQGFPAIDFLLFGANSATTLGRYTTDAGAANAKKYLSAITASIKTKAGAVASAWSSTYMTTFNAATGVNAGSSLSLLMNSFVQDYDVELKNYKIGIPIGKYGTTALPLAPDKVEGYYSGISLQLLTQQIKALQLLYTGGTGNSFDDKVIASKYQKNGVPLNNVINAEFTAIFSKLAVLSDPLSGAINNNLTAVNDAYTEITKMVVLLKVDLSSALGIKISFQDDDGD